MEAAERYDALEEPDSVSAAPEPARATMALGAPSPWSGGLEGYCGIMNQWVSGGERTHGFAGGELYLRYLYAQAGPFIELTDSGEASGLLESRQEQFRTVGGFVGAWLPIDHFVDVNASIGYGTRLYLNPSEIYGASGLSERTNVLELRLGVSDRALGRVIGARIGAAIVGTADLDPRGARWHRTYLLEGGGVGETVGTTAIGGITVGLLVSAALELGGK